MYTIIRITALMIGCVLLSLSSFGQQTPYLEKKVTIRQSTLTYSALFRQLSNQTGVVFSYTRFDDSRKVTVSYEQKTLRSILNELFDGGTCSYKLKGRYIILTCKTPEKPKSDAPTDVVVNGFIYSADDSTQVAESSVYLRQNRQSTVTDDKGYFSMSFPKTSDVLSISVAKEEYEDTTIVILSKQRNSVVIYLQPKEAEVDIVLSDSITISMPMDTTLSKLADTLDEVGRFWDRFRKQRVNLRNIIGDTIFNNVSISFVPPLSTNRLLALNTVNRVSFNILVGYSQGVEGFELGGLVNLDYGDVKYFQLGGLANLVSGDVTGVQVGGLINTVGKKFEGVQVGGLFNFVGGPVSQFQLAGLGNVVRDSVVGVQVGGLTNITTGRVYGFQLGGIYNQTPGFYGMQLGGIANTADTLYGSQIAGIVNNAKAVYGFQLAGLVNRAGDVYGSQVGFVNISRNITGVPFGFFNYVHNGYHKLELAVDENKFGTFSFRTGVNAFHNIFMAGIQFKEMDSSPLWTFGYGLGTSFRLTDKWYLGADLTTQNVQMANSSISYNMLNKAFLGVEYRVAKRFNIVAGPTLNWYNAESDVTESAEVWARFNQRTLLDDDNGSFVNRLWIGGKVALRFL